MLIAYNNDQKLVVYKLGHGMSCFGLHPEKAKRIAPEIASQCEGKTQFPLEFVEVSSETYDALHDAFVAERFSTVHGYQVPKRTPRKFVDAVLEAFKSKRPLLVEYKEGWGSMADDGHCNESGNVHVCWVSRTTGSTKSFIHLEKPSNIGGPLFSFHGLKSVQVLPA